MQKKQKILDIEKFKTSYKKLIESNPEIYGSLNKSDDFIQKAYIKYVNFKLS